MKRIARQAKRFLDCIIATLMLLLVTLPLLIIGVLIKLEDGGSVFFRQQRVGLNGKLFRVWKFRTMTETRVDPQAPDPLAQNDSRITRVGKILRSLGIDELPQLLNVLSGEMSLVGPRPTLAYQAREYTAFQRRRLEAKPGITGLAVVSGRNALTWEERIKLDVHYIDHWTLGLDLRILFQTLWKVLVTREGLYGQNGANDMFLGQDVERGDEDQKGDWGGET